MNWFLYKSGEPSAACVIISLAANGDTPVSRFTICRSSLPALKSRLLMKSSPSIDNGSILSCEGGGMYSCPGDRKSTRLNSSHVAISYAVFCLKKKKKKYRRWVSK